MSEMATFQNFINRDKDTECVEVVGRYPGGRNRAQNINMKHPISHYKSLWEKHYKAECDYFDGHGWFTDLKGDFTSKAAADEAFANLEAAIQKADTCEGHR